ncbi:MAG TPA: hypothetical protein PLZ45_01190 [Ferruginibacter sp.]|nr:hypothetical protein [Chitinophagaceae bacterium]HRI23251.1 hypothetical protein [Ferruginibacter sp.]
MPHDEQLSGEKSLAIIHQMISQAKANITDSGLPWLLWGTMLILASLSTYFFISTNAENLFLGWNIFGAVTVVLLAYDALKPKRKKVKTYIDELMMLVDIGFFVCIFVIILSINISVTPGNGFGYMLMVFAFQMLIKGGAAKSKALIVGAVVNWAGAIAVFINKEFKYDMLIMAGAVLIGYIIPGFILWAEYKKTNNISGN